MDAKIGLAPRPASAAIARHFVRRRLVEWGRRDIGETAELLTSELVTNAILHAGPELFLQLSLISSGLRVTVVDGTAELPEERQRRDDLEGGRGLQLVETLADSWGIRRTGPGKAVWFQLA